jgi:hypothetical protein
MVGLRQVHRGHRHARLLQAPVQLPHGGDRRHLIVFAVEQQRGRAARVDAVVIGTRPELAEATVRECAELGIKHVWMHRGPGAGSVSPAPAEYGRQHDIRVIEGGCPLMFDPTADFGHKAMRVVFTLTGKVPRQV